MQSIFYFTPQRYISVVLPHGETAELLYNYVLGKGELNTLHLHSHGRPSLHWSDHTCPFSQVLRSTGPKTHCVMTALFVMKRYCSVTRVTLPDHMINKATCIKTMSYLLRSTYFLCLALQRTQILQLNHNNFEIKILFSLQILEYILQTK